VKALSPKGAESVSEQLKLSAGIASNGHIFLTGMTGSNADGTMPDTLERQFINAFEKIGHVLALRDADHSNIVEMTSYHVGIDDHFDIFSEVRARYVFAPYPAWTAVEVAGLRRKGANVEIRIIAQDPNA